jgi:hypothetical protein
MKRMNTDLKNSIRWELALTLLAVLLVYSPIMMAQESAPSFAAFKQELMPQVGKTITVEGVLQSAKLGWLVAFNDWGIYLYSTNDRKPEGMNALNRFSGMNVRVTGKLRYFPKPAAPAGDVSYAIPPEHFFFDVADAKVRLIQAPIKEVVRKPLTVSVAPAECLATFRQFFTYVQQDKPSIITDNRAQSRWLTKDLREALKQKLATFKDQPDDPDYPGNGTFVGTWDKPTTFTIIGSRTYGDRAVIDVWYAWGKGTNYPGDTRLSYFIFRREDGQWKLDDVYTFRGEFASAESLNAYLRSK